MAKDKRTPMSTDMNDIDLNDPDAMTDQERKKLAESMKQDDMPVDDQKAM